MGWYKAKIVDASTCGVTKDHDEWAVCYGKYIVERPCGGRRIAYHDQIKELGQSMRCSLPAPTRNGPRKPKKHRCERQRHQSSAFPQRRPARTRPRERHTKPRAAAGVWVRRRLSQVQRLAARIRALEEC